MNEKGSKVIKNSADARKLLQMGNIIIDIKPKKENRKETVFVFLKNEKFDSDFEKININKIEIL